MEQPQIGDNRCYQKFPQPPAAFTLPLAPTWGPQPWHGYSIAVWFSSGPWSKQTSFALLFRSCGKRQNIARQSSQGELLYPTLVPPASAQCKGHRTTPHVRTKVQICEVITIAGKTKSFGGCCGRQPSGWDTSSLCLHTAALKRGLGEHRT